jgi:PPOX class probable F420-dependent enzyme
VIALPGAAAELIAAGRVARLATAGTDGQPLVIPICYAFDGRRFFSAIDAKPKRVDGKKLRRVRNIEQNPRVSLVVDEYDEDWRRLRYVSVDGVAELLSAGAEFSRGIDLLLAKYAQYREMRLDRAEGLLIRVTPHAVRHWAFAA